LIAPHFEANLRFSLLAASAIATPRKENAKLITKLTARLNPIAEKDVPYWLMRTGGVVSVTLASNPTKYITKRRIRERINATRGGFSKSYMS
jgi:hypothetical protein